MGRDGTPSVKECGKMTDAGAGRTRKNVWNQKATQRFASPARGRK